MSFSLSWSAPGHRSEARIATLSTNMISFPRKPAGDLGFAASSIASVCMEFTRLIVAVRIGIASGG